MPLFKTSFKTSQTLSISNDYQHVAEYIHNFLPNLNLQSSFSGTLRGQTLIGSFTRCLSFQFQPGTHRGAFGTKWRQTSKCAQPTRTSKARRILIPTFQLKMNSDCRSRRRYRRKIRKKNLLIGTEKKY